MMPAPIIETFFYEHYIHADKLIQGAVYESLPLFFFRLP